MFREIQALSLSGRARDEAGSTGVGDELDSIRAGMMQGRARATAGVGDADDGDGADDDDVDDDEWEARLDAMTARSQSTVSGLDDGDGGGDGGGGGGGGGGGDRQRLQRIRHGKRRHKRTGHSALFEYDDTTLPDAKLTIDMRERLSTAQAELQAYEDRRIGVGKALAFIGQLEKGVAAMCELDDTRTRSKFEQAARLDEQAELRRAAEAKARAAEEAATAQDSTVQTLRKKVFVLEKQKDLETAAFLAGFVRLNGYIGERERDMTAKLTAVAAKQAAILARVNEYLDERRRARDATEAALKATLMDPEEYIKGEPLSAKGIKAYLLLHSALLEARETIAARDKTIATLRKEHSIQLFHIQRKLKAAGEENDKLLHRVGAKWQ